MLRGHSSRPSGSRKSSENGYVLSVNIYGRGDVLQGDLPAHWGAMLHKRGDPDGDLYHIRKNEHFYYESPTQKRAVESATCYGRMEIQHLSNTGKETAARILDAYGKDKFNLPHGHANSQDWTVGALGALERERLVPRGTKDYWSQHIGLASLDAANRVRQDGGSWVPVTAVNPGGRGCADATFGKEQVRKPVGRLNLDQFAGISGSSQPRW
ncbi:unnamed protein product [Penicillium egyptiacum]|uniref:Uncharacterized protein n=1 Tax=Penicillium egyptiacum TaxID=1303716 RepID=A0A9W4P2L9_9EURO|nr:unnamed protein product [Penicillium egyptiacum]